MADFCKQCSEELFGEDFRDLAGLLDDMEDGPDGYFAEALCEGCGPCWVDNSGTCHVDCTLHHGSK